MLKTYDKKRAMLAHKDKLLQDIKYYETRIQEFPTNTPCFYYDGNSSSDSADDLPTLNARPSKAKLYRQEKLLKTCIRATQELTGVGVLQSEINVMVEDPVLEGEKPVSEVGSWREVTAECRIDLVPFSVTFYTHQPSRKFAPKSFRGLRVLPVKTVQEAELSNSVLPTLTQPSDAIEVLRSYAVAYRSRRSSLARLADRYANSLFMQPLKEGGFVLKCGNLLTVSWRLENRLSAVSPFHHKMNFELDYMDESYLKIIKHAHHQLSDPSLMTDERTLLLVKIISTCLEAQGQTQELYESIESEPESVKKLEKTILDESSDEESGKRRDEQQTHKRKRDAEVMAPPKTIPKKAKPKGKENMDENRKSVKRSSQVDVHGAKKARTGDTNVEISVTDIVGREEANAVTKNKKKIVASQQNKEKHKEGVENDTEKAQKQNKNKIVDKPKSNGAVNDDKNPASKNSTKDKETVVSQGNEKNSNKDITSKKVGKNDKATKSQVKPTDIKNNTVSSTNINYEKAEHNEPNAKKAKVTEKNVSQNPKISKTSKNEKYDAENKESVVNENKNAEVIEDNVDRNMVNTKNYEKTTQSSKAKTTKISDPANVKKILNSDHTKKSVNSNKANAKKINSDSANAKKTVSSDPANAKRSINSDTANPKKTISSDAANAKKIANSDPANAKTRVNTDPANAKTRVNTNPANAKARVNTDPANAKTKVNTDPANAKTSVNADPATSKKPVNPDLANAKNKVNSNPANAKNTIIEKGTKINSVATKNTAESNTKSDAEKIPKDIEVATTENATAKSVATSKKDTFVADNTKTFPKNHSALNSVANAKTLMTAKNQENTKRIHLKNHRNSSGKVAKKIIAKNLKPNISNESKCSKIPQKKLSPAYAAVLKQNPVRMSPRATTKFKSTSDSNLQSKLFKTATNIPRLLKKPVPKSK